MILLTGGAGLVGSALAARWPNASTERIELTDLAAVRAQLERVRPTLIVHCAAMTAVDRAQVEAERAWRINVDATAEIATWARANAARMVYVSTDYVFDGRAGPYDEDAAVNPSGVYAITKAAGEMAVRALVTDHVIARTSVPYGTHPKKDFVRWVREELGAKRSIRVVTDQISNPTLVTDLASAIDQLAHHHVRGTFHTVGSTALDRFSFAQLIARRFSLDASLIMPIKTADLRQAAPRPLNPSLRSDKLQALGVRMLSAEAGLAALI